LVGQQLRISMRASADDSSVVRYTLSDGDPSHDVTGRVLVLKIADDTPNRPPVANPDIDRVVTGNSVDVPVLANDIDPESDPIRLLTAEDPAGGVGTAEVEGDLVRFTPNLPDIDESTPVTFTYRIGDGHGNTATGQVKITVLAAPLPRNPTAVNDPAETVVGKPITIDVLRNDSDPNGGKPHLLGEPVCPNGGNAVTTPDERITFTPPADEVDGGVYRCLYKVLGSQGQAEAWIIVTVKPVTLGNHDPEINPGAIAQTIPVGSSFTFNANVVAHDPDDDPLVFSSVSKPSLGSTNFGASSSSFTYVASTSATSELPATVSLDVQISDNRGGDVTTQISIRVVAIPTAPSATPSTRTIPRPAEVDSSITVDVIGDLRLMPANQGIELSLVGAKADTAGQADVTPNLGAGTVTIVPHVTGNVSVSYTVQSRDQKSASGTILLSVTPKPVVNAAPVAGDDSLTVPSGGSGSVNLLQNDTGITDPGDQAQAALLFPPPASFGVVKVSNGVLTLTANPDYPGGSFQASYNLGDGTGRSDTGAVVLTIEACTVSPPAAQSATAFTPYMTPINIDLNTLVTSGNIVNSSIRGAGLTGPTGTYTPPAGKNDSEVVTFDVVNACNQVAHGTLTIDVNRAPTAHSTSLNVSPGQVQTLLPANIADDDEPLSITALQGQPVWVTRAADGSSITAAPPAGTPSNSYTFTATVADPGGLSTTATITVTVNNIAPTAVDDAFTTADAVPTLLTLSPTANDFDAEPGPLSIQTVSLRDGPGQVVGYTDTTVTVNVGHGVSHFSYTIRDSGGLTATATITVTANRPPTAADVSGTTNQSTVLIDFSASDPDGDKVDIACSPPQGWQIEILANPSPPPTVWLYVTIPPDAPRPSLQQFVCVVTDRPYGAQTTATVTLRIV
ncbi:MAG TPA: Ig-like domain-containing protein, partial [Ilumatobacteraceae bacterium]|nr:Ig-like domain-containing protein [Ilumatobacteraceae bacterium]